MKDKNGIIKKKKLETVARGYYNVIITDVMHLLEKYMTLVKNFPVNFNGSQLRQTIESLKNKLNKVNLEFLKKWIFY